jgi:hypothetical protein
MPLSDGGKCHHAGRGLQERWADTLKAACFAHWLRAFSKKLAHSPKLPTHAPLATPANPSLVLSEACRNRTLTAGTCRRAVQLAHCPHNSVKSFFAMLLSVRADSTRFTVQPGRGNTTMHAQRARSLSQSFACHSPKNGTCSDAY